MKSVSLPNKTDTGKILFIVNTEFALLIAILHFLENLSQSGEAVFILLKVDDTRFKNINFDKLPGENYVFLNNMTESVIFPDKCFEQVLYLENVTNIVLQHPYDVLTQVIIQKYLKEKNNIFLTLINDGTTKSIDIKGWNRIKFFIKMLFRKYFNGYTLLSFNKYRQNIRFYINCFIADQNIGIEQFINTNKLLANIFKYKKLISAIYNFTELDQYEKSDIIFFTQPIKFESFLTNSQKELYEKILHNLSNLAKTKKISVLLKIHPGEYPDDYKKFTNAFVTIVWGRNVPAEVILNLVKDKIVISMYSSLSLYENNRNKHFWLHNIMNYKMNTDMEFISTPDDFEIFQNEMFEYLDEVKRRC